MDPVTIAIISLRSFAMLFGMQGRPEIGQAISSALGAYQAGRNIDDHLQLIADTLQEGGELADWKNIIERIDDETAAFLGT